MRNSTQWHTKDAEDVILAFESDAKRGLHDEEAKNRVDTYGLNELVRIGKAPWYKVFLRQFTNVLILILFAAAVISLAVGEPMEPVTPKHSGSSSAMIPLPLRLVTTGICCHWARSATWDPAPDMWAPPPTISCNSNSGSF